MVPTLLAAMGKDRRHLQRRPRVEGTADGLWLPWILLYCCEISCLCFQGIIDPGNWTSFCQLDHQLAPLIGIGEAKQLGFGVKATWVNIFP